MKKRQSFWRLARSLENLLFYLLILLLPVQLGKHFWPNFSKPFGLRIDYLSPTIYLTDLIVISLLFLWVLELLKNRPKKNLPNSKKILACLFFFLFIFFNIYFSETKPLVLYKWVKAVFFFALVFYIKKRKIYLSSSVLKVLGYSSLLFVSLGITQFIKGGSIGGIFYFLGERNFSIFTPGIALTSLFGKYFLRPYSSFSHPNSFSGFYLVVFLLILKFYQPKTSFEKRLKSLFLLLSFFVVIITFSLAAQIALVFSILVDLLTDKYPTVNNLIRRNFLVLITFLSLVTPLFFQKINLIKMPKTVTERIETAELSLSAFANNPFFGIGLGNFTGNWESTLNEAPTGLRPGYLLPLLRREQNPSEAENSSHLFPRLRSGFSAKGDKNFLLGTRQPVHNLFLLVLSEAGAFGLLLFFYFLLQMMNKISRQFLIIYLAIIITGLFDHYWLTLQQNTLLLFLVLGFSSVGSYTKNT